jgi:poly-gamma-glutamate capsule biosynthesis protein CapA/YwtB (metallophosphatase superfamily)
VLAVCVGLITAQIVEAHVAHRPQPAEIYDQREAKSNAII